ncbi:hypothetical protein Dvina_11780 [Dactylosporangium vinaceum]|uniref:Major facilitator superfamily (MFS) profile domain-containing protein n=1 Tax=Dactylosporangium vinaceum TaxID=53362 RepID=A0ABV5MFA4_9ACTN|nr:hypothetical protein [Dactylosporangium vinaceum]UAB98693.1 hypothetical protein Dvina_11780 [Dactylosporangium vinaceum]
MDVTRRLARAGLLAAGTAAFAVSLAGVLVRGSIEAAYGLAYSDGGAGRARTALVVGVLLGAAAAGCCLYAAEHLRTSGGRGPAWLVCALLAGGLSPALFGGGTIAAPRIVGAGATAAEIGADIAALTPRWYVPVVATLSMLTVCAAILVAMLLVVPAPPAQPPR